MGVIVTGHNQQQNKDCYVEAGLNINHSGQLHLIQENPIELADLDQVRILGLEAECLYVETTPLVIR